MRESKTHSETIQRIQAVETQLADKLRAMFGLEAPAAEVSEKADRIRGKSDELRQKLSDNDESVWGAVKDEVNRDLHALEGDFDHWIQYLDQHYKEQE